MVLRVCFIVIIVNVCFGLRHLDDHRSLFDRAKSVINVEDGHAGVRRSRSLSLREIGVKGLTKLLRGARETNHQINTYQRFEKGGGFDAALKDFYSVNPTDVTRIHGRGRLSDVYTGKIGDRDIRMAGFDRHMRSPVIQVTDPKTGRFAYKIIYRRSQKE